MMPMPFWQRQTAGHWAIWARCEFCRWSAEFHNFDFWMRLDPEDEFFVCHQCARDPVLLAELVRAGYSKE
jgi:primosomal protein N'